MMRTIGFPRMHKEAGERRDFLPNLMEFVDRVGVSEIVIEEGYGTGMGFVAADYLKESKKVRVGTYEECLVQDIVAVLRCPADDAIRKIRRNAIALSMFHYATRPSRVALLTELGIRAVSLDGVMDDQGKRLVENLAAVGWNGVRAAFRELAKTYARFESPNRRPLRVTVMGSGAVGGHAIRAASRYGDQPLRDQMVMRKVPGVEVRVVDYDLTSNENYMLDLLEQTDVLVDATQRPDPSCPVVPNVWVASLPQHAVLLDLSVDPYDLFSDPPTVKGIEGVPEGNLDQYTFLPDDPVYARMDPRIPTANRRVALSCYSWPGVDPRSCMEVYGTQIQPVLRILIERDEWDAVQGPYYERAVAQAEVSWWRTAHPRTGHRRAGV